MLQSSQLKLFDNIFKKQEVIKALQTDLATSLERRQQPNRAGGAVFFDKVHSSTLGVHV